MTKSTFAKLIFGALAVAFSLGFVSEANAVPILLDTDNVRFLGTIVDGIPPSGEPTYINNLLTVALGQFEVIGTETYFRSNNPCVGCPAADGDGSVKDESESNAGNFLDGFTYLVAKYDAAQAGSLVWDVRGLTGDFEVPAEFNGHAVSHWALYGPFVQTPEPMTLTLLGFGLAGLGLVARRRSR